MKVKDALKVLPYQIRLQVIVNIKRDLQGSMFTLKEILNNDVLLDLNCGFLSPLFVFNKTEQGHEYWSNISKEYTSKINHK